MAERDGEELVMRLPIPPKAPVVWYGVALLLWMPLLTPYLDLVN